MLVPAMLKITSENEKSGRQITLILYSRIVSVFLILYFVYKRVVFTSSACFSDRTSMLLMQHYVSTNII